MRFKEFVHQEAQNFSQFAFPNNVNLNKFTNTATQQQQKMITSLATNLQTMIKNNELQMYNNMIVIPPNKFRDVGINPNHTNSQFLKQLGIIQPNTITKNVVQPNGTILISTTELDKQISNLEMGSYQTGLQKGWNWFKQNAFSPGKGGGLQSSTSVRGY